MLTKQVTTTCSLIFVLLILRISPRLLTLSEFKRADDGDGDGGKLEVNIKLPISNS